MYKVFEKEDESKIDAFVNVVSKYFTFVVISIASFAAIYWFPIDSSLAFNALTAVLIIACPCALALSTPFTLGSSMRIFGRNKFYLKSTHIIEKLSSITSIVFDKTGTITETKNAHVNFQGDDLSDYEKKLFLTADVDPFDKRYYWPTRRLNLIGISTHSGKISSDFTFT